ncbi:nitrate ABC transporter substrate-binding protein [Burkholderia sp. WAC0059]|uniref:ABC transporter substrate-binding protein n=1 Tax=Burkholderia sp. WAC0059 TaxID=2066022 RepID=UPI000C7E9ECE|nr:ABC transporter substrate-binding protein [Burkholderia sp. WAC0059]PLZ00613.1 nitrate ABC transporter substrate-binding protein [Burkholderia sp. WAC0059]
MSRLSSNRSQTPSKNGLPARAGLRRLKRRAAPLLAALAVAGGAVAAAAAFADNRPSASGPALTSITLQLDPITAIAQDKGFLKSEYAKIGVNQVTLVAPGTAQMIGAEAAQLNSGGIAVAQRMIYPAVVHRANGLDAVIVWESQPSDKYRTPLLARAGNDRINDVRDLDGKKFASSRVSCYWTAPFETLIKAGLPLDSRTTRGRVRYQSIDSTNVVTAALLSGAIDATAMHLGTSNAAALYLSHQVKVIGRTPDHGEYTDGAGRVSYFAMRSFADQHPEAIHAFLVAIEQARTWALAHPDEAAQIVAHETRVPVEIARFQITDPSEFDFMAGEPDADNVRTTIKQFQAWYVAHGDDILSERHLSDGQIDAMVDGRFFAGGKYSAYQ